MDVPTVYVEKPTDAHGAWASLARLLDQLKALFSLIAEASDEEEGRQDLYHAAVLGEELSQEAEQRAELLHGFIRREAQHPAPAEDQSSGGEF
jgi:hypothetical protein